MCIYNTELNIKNFSKQSSWTESDYTQPDQA